MVRSLTPLQQIDSPNTDPDVRWSGRTHTHTHCQWLKVSNLTQQMVCDTEPSGTCSWFGHSLEKGAEQKKEKCLAVIGRAICPSPVYRALTSANQTLHPLFNCKQSRCHLGNKTAAKVWREEWTQHLHWGKTSVILWFLFYEQVETLHVSIVQHFVFVSKCFSQESSFVLYLSFHRKQWLCLSRLLCSNWWYRC